MRFLGTVSEWFEMLVKLSLSFNCEQCYESFFNFVSFIILHERGVSHRSNSFYGNLNGKEGSSKFFKRILQSGYKETFTSQKIGLHYPLVYQT